MEFLPMLILVAGAIGITAVARQLAWPAPLLVTGVALAVAGIPGVPEFEIDSHIILTLVLPPLLYSAALNVSLLNFTRSRKHISRLGIWLVILTALVVGFVVYRLVPDMTLPAAFLLGAIVAPPDAVSAAAIGRKLGLPRHVMTVLSGESLINDAASLTLFKVFLLIIGGTSLTLLQDVGIFALAVIVGVAVGLVIGVAFHWIRMRIHDAVVETAMGLVVPFVAYIGAEELQGSGVLAVVAAGLWIGYNSPKTGYAARLTERPVWSSIDLMLEGFVFALIGLQMKPIAESLEASGRGVWPTVGVAVVVLLVVILIRPAFVFSTHHLARARSRAQERLRVQRLAEATRRPARRLHRGLTLPEPRMDWRELTVVSWTSMRGVVTLAAAAGVPAVTGSGTAVPAHDVIVFVAFFVTVGTLMLQGLTLPFVIRRLGVSDPQEEHRDREEKRAVLRVTTSEAIEYLQEHRDGLVGTYGADLVDRVEQAVRLNHERLRADIRAEAEDERRLRPWGLVQQGELRRKLLRRQREILVRERDKGTIDEEVMREVLGGIDAQELALDTSMLHWDRV